MNIHRIYIYAPIAGAYPADLEQALAQGEQIRQSGSGQAVPEALLTMAAKLEEYAEKWSEGVNEDEDEDDELQERLGNLKARVQRKGVPVISFEMPHEGWERLLWEMVEKAGPLGLVVVDDQTLTAFLPEGKVYPESQLAGWREMVAGFERENTEIRKEENLPQTLRQFITWSKPMYEDYFHRHGFGESLKGPSGELRYQRSFGVVRQSMSFDYRGRYPNFRGFDIFKLHCPIVCAIVANFNFPCEDDKVCFLTIENQAGSVSKSWPPVSKSAMDYELGLIEKNIMSVANMAIDLKGLDKVLNDFLGISEHSRIFLDDYLPHRLVIARLAERKDFDELTERLRSSVPPLRVHYIEKIDQLIQYLRDEVQPLV